MISSKSLNGVDCHHIFTEVDQIPCGSAPMCPSHQQVLDLSLFHVGENINLMTEEACHALVNRTPTRIRVSHINKYHYRKMH